jgi:hypothetical protein
MDGISILGRMCWQIQFIFRSLLWIVWQLPTEIQLSMHLSLPSDTNQSPQSDVPVCFMGHLLAIRTGPWTCYATHSPCHTGLDTICHTLFKHMHFFCFWFSQWLAECYIDLLHEVIHFPTLEVSTHTALPFGTYHAHRSNGKWILLCTCLFVWGGNACCMSQHAQVGSSPSTIMPQYSLLLQNFLILPYIWAFSS